MYPPEVTSCYAPKVRGIYYPATDTYEDLDGLRARVVELTIDLAETERERQKAVEREAKTAEYAEVLRNERDVLAGSLKDVRLGELHWDADAGEWIDGPAPSLPTPDCDNPAHLRWFASFLDTFTTAISPEGRPWAEKVGGVYDEACQRADRLQRLEAAQQQDDADDTLRAEVERVAMDVEAAKASMAIAAMRKLDGAKWHDIDVPDIEATLTALRDAGFAVVELPKLGPADEIRVIDGMVVDVYADVWRSPDEARTEAAGLLAAADAAERGES